VRLPCVDLKLVQRLAEEDRFALSGGPACLGALESYLHGEFGRYRPFAQAIIRELRLEDFHRTRRWPEPGGELADEYGLRLSRAVLDAFEVDVSTWYVKVTVRRNRQGELLFFMSLHPLAFDMVRNGGLLRPER
jgi:hypothetical protein